METEDSAKKTSCIAIIQPGYLPWLGFFEQVSRCDVFVYLDDVQYTKNDWRNRNRIKTKDGTQWLSVPVSYSFGQKIKDVHINNSQPWYRNHLQALKMWYSRSAYYKGYIEELDYILRRDRKYLIDLNVELSSWVMKLLGLNPQIRFSSEILIDSNDKQMRLVQICKVLNCNYFYEGKLGQQYIDVNLFRDEGITVKYQEYSHPYYQQQWLKEQNYISHLSIIDLLFNCGPDSLDILTGLKTIPLPPKVLIRHADEFKKS